MRACVRARLYTYAHARKYARAAANTWPIGRGSDESAPTVSGKGEQRRLPRPDNILIRDKGY